MSTWVSFHVHVSWRRDVGLLLAYGRTIKFHFCRENVFELAIKQRFSPPSQRTTRPRRGVGPFSFFVYSPANWFCGIHHPFFSSSSLPSSTILPQSQEGPWLFRGTQIHPVCVWGMSEREGDRGERERESKRIRDTYSAYNVIDKNQRIGRKFYIRSLFFAFSR